MASPFSPHAPNKPGGGAAWPVVWQGLATMNQEQLLGIVRHLLGAAGAYVVAKGLADENVVIQASGAVSTLVAIGWSVFSKLQR